ncbi:MAG: hypothetical protein EOO50_08405 [Flavobacterium sp.]|uniref:hypothetical protein n=1 Tax=Flavobacterium sp. TaxID=239 RepID=UPI0012253DA5|nr:hypothetical protein [Flavobacterium sp.]RZJ66706.1 MAG: hypothetical protein EOO50_08405 [Flavobacterium sp.]
MDKTDFILGLLIGLTGALAGSFLFIVLFTNYSVMDGLHIIRQTGQISKVLALGAIVNLVAFFILLQLKKDLMARGVVLSMIVITVITLVLQIL